ncbi:YciI family protein [Nakamurella lactea]|uniref:YciI family protein n=1 Tax=Nakamurella lactea TaxID=459515 RepID=UPI000685FCB2|nr:YciI family protein [Nakamurella lactea]
MDFLIDSRASVSALEADDDPDLDERHWAYFDRFADALTARGPVLGPDRQSWTGSIHVLDLPSPAAVLEFINNEPYHQAGAYGEHSVWRFTNLIGRTMWDFRQPWDGPLFFTLVRPGRSTASEDGEAVQLSSDVARDLAVCGILEDVDAESSAGSGVAVAAPAPNRHAANELFEKVFPSLAREPREVRDWRFGGRRA